MSTGIGTSFGVDLLKSYSSDDEIVFVLLDPSKIFWTSFDIFAVKIPRTCKLAYTRASKERIEHPSVTKKGGMKISEALPAAQAAAAL